MDRKTLQTAGALFVILPMLLGAVKWTIAVYEHWRETQERIERLERWRCAMGSKPQGSTEWTATDWQRECPARTTR